MLTVRAALCGAALTLLGAGCKHDCSDRALPAYCALPDADCRPLPADAGGFAEGYWALYACGDLIELDDQCDLEYCRVRYYAADTRELVGAQGEYERSCRSGYATYGRTPDPDAVYTGGCNYTIISAVTTTETPESGGTGGMP